MVGYSARFVLAILLHVYFVHGLPKNYGSEYTFPFYSRADWGALPSRDVRPFNLPVPYVVIHHTYIPPACNTTSECMEAMREMQEFHNSIRFGDIGYNFCLGSDGAVYEGRGWKNIGVHATRANSISIGICLIGDWRAVSPSAEMLASTKALIATGVDLGIISPTYKLVGHKQVTATQCPGTALFNIISTWDHFLEHIDF